MGKRYLLLGASSDLCCAFLRRHIWQSDDEIVAQYFRNAEELKRIANEKHLHSAEFLLVSSGCSQ